MRDKISKFYTILVIVYPILYTYLSVVDSITIADLFLIITLMFGIIDIVSKKEKFKMSFILLIIIVLLCVHQLISFIVYSFEIENFAMFFRVIIYMLSCLILAKKYFNFNYGCVIYKFMSVFASVYLIIQYLLMKTIRYYLPGTIPFLKTSSDISEYNMKMLNSMFDRPRSIFIEPAHFSIYVSIFLAIYLFSEKKINYKLTIILTLAILLSGSSTGIGIVIFIYFLYFFEKFTMKKINIKSLTILFLFIIIGLAFTRTQMFDIFIQRTIYSGDAVSGRFSTYSVLNDNSFNLIRKIFGIGFYKLNSFHPSFIRIFLFNGWFGLILYHLIILITIKNSNKIGRKVAILFYIFSLSSSIVYSRWLILIIPILLSNSKKNSIIIEDNS